VRIGCALLWCGLSLVVVSDAQAGPLRAGAARVPAYALPQRVSQGRVIRAEWTKLRTQPSALWAGAASAGLTAGFGILYSLLREARPPHGATAQVAARSRSPRSTWPTTPTARWAASPT